MFLERKKKKLILAKRKGLKQSKKSGLETSAGMISLSNQIR